jgi:hypothetical protein
MNSLISCFPASFSLCLPSHFLLLSFRCSSCSFLSYFFYFSMLLLFPYLPRLILFFFFLTSLLFFPVSFLSFLLRFFSLLFLVPCFFPSFFISLFLYLSFPSSFVSLFIAVPSAPYFQMRHWSNIMNVSVSWSVTADKFIAERAVRQQMLRYMWLRILLLTKLNNMTTNIIM